MEPVKTETDFNLRIAAAKPVVAVFKTAWCKDCHYIEPFIPDVERKYTERLTFIAVDRDELPELCEQYNILGIPSFIVFRKGKELTRFVNKLRKTHEEIEQFLDRSVQVADALDS